MKRNIPLYILLSTLLTVTACTPSKTVKPADKSQTPEAAAAASTAAQPTQPTESAEANLRGSTFVAAPDLETINFGFDSYTLAAPARTTLKANAEYLKAHPDLDVLATGNCDDRGTIAYNLALGQKRAQAVREYYIRLGVSGTNIATISYGKEKPICSESTEECWAKNRRAETLVRAHAEQKPSTNPSISQ